MMIDREGKEKLKRVIALGDYDRPVDMEWLRELRSLFGVDRIELWDAVALGMIGLGIYLMRDKG